MISCLTHEIKIFIVGFVELIPFALKMAGMAFCVVSAHSICNLLLEHFISSYYLLLLFAGWGCCHEETFSCDTLEEFTQMVVFYTRPTLEVFVVVC